MLITIHQPQYLPWLGYIDKIDKADIFVILDNVQFKKNEWQNRNMLKTSLGWQWITVPVLCKFREKIVNVRIKNSTNWQRKHLQALVTNYSNSPYFHKHKGFFEEIYKRSWDTLASLNLAIIQYLIQAFGIQTKLILASDLTLREGPTERLIDICKTQNSKKYLSGRDGAKYMDLEKFCAEGIEIIYQDFKHPVYDQLYGNFLPNMSAVDLLFNCGNQGLQILRGNKKKISSDRKKSL
ncbi:MAG: WbqC family protein [Planctomycetes bacterium]|nr:WbqC family protein [Planctomycetota bacterium]